MRTAHRYHLLDVFTTEIFGGNQLAVFPDAAGIASGQMPRIARELNLSETVFVLPADSADASCRMRIFTPGAELPFAGHPTVGTACLLASLGQVPLRDGAGEITFEQGAGLVRVKVRGGAPDDAIARDAASGDAWFAQLTAPGPPEVRGVEHTRDTLAALLGLDVADIVDDERARPAAAGTGSPFLFVPVASRDALARSVLDHATWSREVAGAWAKHVFVHTFDAEREGSHVRARMYAPALGIPEDPATGSAAAGLAALLAMHAGSDGTHRWRMEQGFEMGRPSILELEADVSGGAVTGVRVGGGAVMVGDGHLRLPRS